MNNYTHTVHTVPGEPHNVFYVSFWDPGRKCIEPRIVEQNYCKFDRRSHKYRADWLNVRNMGETQVTSMQQNNNYETTKTLGVS